MPLETGSMIAFTTSLIARLQISCTSCRQDLGLSTGMYTAFLRVYKKNWWAQRTKIGSIGVAAFCWKIRAKGMMTLFSGAFPVTPGWVSLRWLGKPEMEIDPLSQRSTCVPPPASLCLAPSRHDALAGGRPSSSHCFGVGADHLTRRPHSSRKLVISKVFHTPRHFPAQGFLLSALPAQLDFLRKSPSTINDSLASCMHVFSLESWRTDFYFSGCPVLQLSHYVYPRSTPFWRKDEGKTVCKACVFSSLLTLIRLMRNIRGGLYYKLHGSARPISMKSDVIHKRLRHDARRTGHGGYPICKSRGQPSRFPS